MFIHIEKIHRSYKHCTFKKRINFFELNSIHWEVFSATEPVTFHFTSINQIKTFTLATRIWVPQNSGGAAMVPFLVEIYV